MDTPELSPESKEAIHRAKNAAQAVEISRAAQLQAHDDKTREIFTEAIKESLGDSPSNQELKSMLDEQGEAIKELSRKLDPILDVYKAIIFNKSFLVGLSSVIIAITAIGIGFMWLINTATHNK